MAKLIVDFQEKVLKVLSGKIDEFYLAGGTALSLYYFHHRDSLDLDFFTPKFNRLKIKKIITILSDSLKKKIELVKEQAGKDLVKISVYLVHINGRSELKLDFVEDCLDLLKPPKTINGINVLSLEDIYLRKLCAIAGTSETADIVGRKVAKGGRREAKDFYDLYCLSHTFMQLSDFSSKYCNQLMRERIIRWFNTYSRMEIKIGLTELGLKKNVEFNEMERHFKKEIDKIIEKEVDFV